ncbi:ferritin-like domain-containing protein [Tepidicaulis sp.]|uniref:ferritin-like domain-containing protein n=1 Tax=Tepidicaulis sp. TaxID=1920809 RepID=UPI003B58C551
MGHWTLDDINWDAFEADAVDPDILAAVKAAAMVEYNAADYVTYLCNVFADYPEIQETIRVWGAEESQHGKALSAWAELADPGFTFDDAFARFQNIYSIPVDATESVRGSRAGEMIARCVVETGTSSFYTAIKDATDEPVLKEIAARIAADEFRHYKLFYDVLRKFEGEAPSLWGRAKVALGRLSEADDDELASAYYAANTPTDGSTPYSRKRFAAAYELRALTLYKRHHTDRLVSMIAKAIGMHPHGRVVRTLSPVVWKVMQFKRRRAMAAAA